MSAAEPATSHNYAEGAAATQNMAPLPFEPGVYHPNGTFIFAKNPSTDELRQIHQMLVAKIGPHVASFEVVKAVYEHNPMSLWGIFRSADQKRRAPKLAGLVAFLPLNKAGDEALRNKRLDGRNPDLSLIARPGEEPTMLYLWAIVTPGMGNLAVMLIGRAIGPDLFERLPIIGWISTRSALESIKRSSKAETEGETAMGSTFEIKLTKEYRNDMRALPIFEGVRPGRRHAKARLDAQLVATAEDMAKVMAVRAAVFMTEQNCPYEEEFDGNDYAGAHILGTVDGEPAAVLRIRYFANFVKIERLAVLPRFRRTLIAREVVERALEICRRKGYRKMYGQSQLRLVSFWERFGFRPMRKDSNLVFSDHEYVEIIGDIEPHENPLTPETDPLVLIRPEGKWDEPGVLDYSAARPATNPH
ncbi:MAG TPA: GNAT family N-acetyltransferase [Rhizomicrobium sp.]|nr:GNAT family N-acetyltransferase [Rhizomicrobium sp.]